MSDIVKECGCGKSYTMRQWRMLELVGKQFTPADDYGPEETLELRNCPCGSTLAVMHE